MKGIIWEPDAVGLYYMRGRWYDPELGRFFEEDPIHSGVNVYAFVGDDPVNGFDPLGLDAECHVSETHECPLPPTTITASGPGGSARGGGVAASAPQAPSSAPGDGAFANGSGGTTPQAQQPANSKSYAACGLKAWKQNWKGLVLDGAGWAVVAAFPEGSLAATVAGSTLGVVGIGVAVADNRGRADGVVSGTLAYAGKQAAVVEAGFEERPRPCRQPQ